MLDIETMEFLKKLIRPIYFWVYRLRGYPGIERCQHRNHRDHQ